MLIGNNDIYKLYFWAEYFAIGIDKNSESTSIEFRNKRQHLDHFLDYGRLLKEKSKTSLKLSLLQTGALRACKHSNRYFFITLHVLEMVPKPIRLALFQLGDGVKGPEAVPSSIIAINLEKIKRRRAKVPLPYHEALGL